MMTRIRALLAVAAFLGIAIGCASLVNRGVYGWTLFAAIPVSTGALASAIVRPSSAARAIGLGLITGAVGCCLFLLLGIEGLACLAMAMPIVVPLAVLGSWLVYILTPRAGNQARIAMALLLPASLCFDVTATPPVFAVRTSIVVNAPPARVWKNVVAFSDIPAPKAWFFRTGVAYPIRARIEGSGPGAVRYCEFSTGTFVEPIVIWDAPRLLRFRVSANPAPMQEISLYGAIHPRHLNGYFVSKRGQFQLAPLSGGRTLLEGTTWYQHGLWPAEYWRWWSDAIVHRIHLRVLEHIRALSERD